MDFSGRIRAAVQRFAPATSREDLLALVMAAAWKGDQGMAAHQLLATSGGARSRQSNENMGHGEWQTGGPADYLWSCWILVLSGRSLHDRDGIPMVDSLWQRAFAHQNPQGHLHMLDANTPLDTFTFEELRAIHAAYNIALVTANPHMMEQVRRAVRWHIANTQPDHTTSEPWALAAFAALDETGPSPLFAEQQLHVAENMLTRAGKEHGAVTLALLADALLTMQGPKE